MESYDAGICICRKSRKENLDTRIFTVAFIEVNRHKSISVVILSMSSDTYDNIMSLSVVKTSDFDVDVCPIGLQLILLLRLPVIAYKLNTGPISIVFVPSKNVDLKRLENRAQVKKIPKFPCRNTYIQVSSQRN